MATRSRRHRSRRKTERRAWSRQKVARALVAAFCALVVALVVVRVGTAGLLVARGNLAAALVAPADPSVVYLVANAELKARGGNVSRETMASVARAAPRTPLADEPFAFAGMAPGRSAAESTLLLEEARRRNPRNRAVRLMLIERYIRDRRVDAAATEIRVVAHLENQVGGMLVDPLARLASDPATRPALSRALGNDRLLDDVLVALVRAGAPADLIVELAAPRMRSYSPARPPDWQRLLVESRVERGDYRQAHALWLRFNRVPDSAAGSLYNPRFLRAPGGPPFNWRLVANASGVAEAGRQGGLEIVYFGRGDAELASQLVPVPAGRYRFTTRASAVDQGRGSHLAWRVTCAAGNARLAEISLDSLARQPRRVQTEFDVPASCPAVWLNLIGEAGEFPSRREIRIEQVQLARSGGQS